jgi:glutaredoxin
MYWIITGPDCPHCDRAKAILEKRGEPYQAFSYLSHPMITMLMGKAGLRTVPQVWHDHDHVGGADALEIYLAELD